MASTTRPLNAYLIPIALTALGALDLGAALVYGGDSATVATQPAMWAYVATAFGGAVELTVALLVAMQRSLGRLLYLTLAPVRIVVAGIASALAYSTELASNSEQAASMLPAMIAGIGLDVAIYAAIAFAMFRPVFSMWLTGAPARTSAAAADINVVPSNLLANACARIVAFLGVLLFTVFVLDAPSALLWAGAIVVSLMLGVRAYLQHR
jgi:hypothetical protein